MNYLNIIDRVSRYYTENKNDIYIDLSFGLFLTIVNMKYSLKDKEDIIPADIRTKMQNIISKNEQLLQYYEEYGDETRIETLLINSLFSNASLWINRLENFKHTFGENETYSRSELNKRYSYWNRYLHEVDRLEDWIPSPKQSDGCLVSLSINPVNYKTPLSWCPVADFCYTMLVKGTDFGYALGHRLLLLIMARMGHGCRVLSEREDKELSQKFCSMAYAEAQYIAFNKYGNADLMLEFTTLCSLESHAEFLHRRWLKNLKRFQLRSGCFVTQIIMAEPPSTLFEDKLTDQALDPVEECNTHTTALAIATYSSAVRFILQKYY
ncbi:unnamed protein product, partial [Brenthis ino]